MNRQKNSVSVGRLSKEQITIKKLGLQAAGKNDILSLCEYEQAIVGSEGLESFRRKHRYGVYIFKIQNHRIVSAEGQPKIFGQL